MFKIAHTWMISSFGSFIWINMITKPFLNLIDMDPITVSRIAVAGMCYMLFTGWRMASELKNFEMNRMAPFSAYLKAGLIAPLYLPLLGRTLRA